MRRTWLDILVEDAGVVLVCLFALGLLAGWWA